jgi:hypothetical protein
LRWHNVAKQNGGVCVDCWLLIHLMMTKQAWLVCNPCGQCFSTQSSANTNKCIKSATGQKRSSWPAALIDASKVNLSMCTVIMAQSPTTDTQTWVSAYTSRLQRRAHISNNLLMQVEKACNKGPNSTSRSACFMQ